MIDEADPNTPRWVQRFRNFDGALMRLREGIEMVWPSAPLPMADGLDLSAKQQATLLFVLSRFADRIERVALFGSRALGRSRPDSDIDLAFYGSLDDRDVARIWSLLDRISLAVSVDVVRHAVFGNVPSRRHIAARTARAA